jgi:hypothetical protein
MGKRPLAKEDTRRRRLERKDSHIRDISVCSDLLYYILFVRFAKQNYDLSLITEMFSCQSKVNEVHDFELTDENQCSLIVRLMVNQ